MEISISQVTAVIGILIFMSLTIFQLLLASGKPYGEYAWGGQHKNLPTKFRVGSLISIGLYTLFSMIFIDESSLSNIFQEGIIKSYGIWFLMIFLLIGVFMNGISRSKKERYTMTPIIVVLLICAVVIGIA